MGNILCEKLAKFYNGNPPLDEMTKGVQVCNIIEKVNKHLFVYVNVDIFRLAFITLNVAKIGPPQGTLKAHSKEPGDYAASSKTTDFYKSIAVDPIRTKLY